MLPRLSDKEFLILELLISRREMYGLEMVQSSGGRLARGTVYVTLERMSDKNYVTSRLESVLPGGGPPRRLYRITGLGESLYRAQSTLNAAFNAALA